MNAPGYKIILTRLGAFALWLGMFGLNCHAGQDNFSVEAVLRPDGAGGKQLVVQVGIQQGNRLYADQFQVSIPAPGLLNPISLPTPVKEKDPLTSEEKTIYDKSFTAIYALENAGTGRVTATVHFQGCNETACFLPDSRTFELSDGQQSSSSAEAESRAASRSGPKLSPATDILQNYHVAASQSGYLNAPAFVSFLNMESEAKSAKDRFRLSWQAGMIWLTLIMIIIGGLALNLTPCVLPLIPVNLAIIGAGIRAASPARGFLLGAVYGLGIVAAYGSLGLAAVLTGAQFGAINASPWFNLSIALLFLILSLALMDRINIDFSRLQSNIRLEGEAPRGPDSKRSGRGNLLRRSSSGYAGRVFAEPCDLSGVALQCPPKPWAKDGAKTEAKEAISSSIAAAATEDHPCGKPQGFLAKKGKGLFFVFALGAISALLAGACVAPVVIAVLLLSADLYIKGNFIGLLLPFLLGLGMALPWPFAGAGLSFLPKPGKWMTHIKHLFALIILLAAFYYGALGIKLLLNKYGAQSDSANEAHQPGAPDGAWLTAFPDRTETEAVKKPILLYFWATWCKNCKAMNATTFHEPSVRQKMADFICVKYQAENPNDPSTADILREFNVLGLPTFVILMPNK